MTFRSSVLEVMRASFGLFDARQVADELALRGHMPTGRNSLTSLVTSELWRLSKHRPDLMRKTAKGIYEYVGPRCEKSSDDSKRDEAGDLKEDSDGDERVQGV